MTGTNQTVISKFAIANENNNMTNSILFVEDPILEGDIYEGVTLQRLVKLAHYERILSKKYRWCRIVFRL